ncbi:MAG: hypothetical protein K5665_08395 [Saccharofermentans sp.]|nr:hypothetical protein [Saccharofermentans sp.]
MSKLTIRIVDATKPKAYFICKDYNIKLDPLDYEAQIELAPGIQELKYTIGTGASISLFAATKTKYKTKMRITEGKNLIMSLTIGVNRTHIKVTDENGVQIPVKTSKLSLA